MAIHKDLSQAPDPASIARNARFLNWLLRGRLDGYNIDSAYLGVGLVASTHTPYRASVDFSGAVASEVAAAGVAGTGVKVSRNDHAHRGVHSIEKSGAGDLFGDVTLSEGAGIGLTQAAQNIAIAATTGVPVGVVLSYAGTSAPTGYLACDGTSYLRADYSALFTAIGTAHGAADGTHFNVPDYRGRFMRGQDNGAGRDPNAGIRTAMNAGGAVGDNVGSVQADATKPNGLATGNQSQDHTHTHSATSGGVSASHDHTYIATSGDANQGFDQIGLSIGGGTCWAPGGGTPTQHQHLVSGTVSGQSAGHTHSVSGTTAGVSQNHTHSLSGDSETRPLNAYVNYIIKT